MICFSFSSVNSVAAEFYFFYMLDSYCIIMQSWDIEANLRLGKLRSSLSVCHWSLNSIWVEEFSELSQVSAFLNVYQFDIFCLIETFLDSSILSEDLRLAMKGSNFSVATILVTCKGAEFACILRTTCRLLSGPI